MPAPGAIRRLHASRPRRCRCSRGRTCGEPRPIPGFSCPLHSAKPRAMNRTGLFIALALWLVIGVVFGLYPELDLKLAALFFDPDTKTFPLKLNDWAGFARDAAMLVSWAFVLPSLVALVVKMIRP